MKNVRLMWQNLIDVAGVTFTPTSEVAGLPASNLAHDLRTKVWRTGTSVAAENVVIDLGVAQSATCVILLDHDLTAGDSAIALEANSADAWGAPPFSQVLTRVAGPISAFFTSASYRYWRLKFTKSAAGQTRQIGRLFIGPHYECERNPQADGFSIKAEDLSVHGKSIGGQRFSDARAQFDTVNLSFNHLSVAQADQFRALEAYCGEFRPFFVSLDHDEEPEDWLYYVALKGLATARAVSVGGNGLPFKWDMDLTLEEQL